MKKSMFILLGLAAMLGVMSGCQKKKHKKTQMQHHEQQEMIEEHRTMTQKERKQLRKERNKDNLMKQTNERATAYRQRKVRRGQRNPSY